MVTPNTYNYVADQLEQAFGLIRECIADVDDDAFNWAPAGTCNSIAKTYAHVGISIDFFVNSVLLGGPMGWPAIAAEASLPSNPLSIWSHNGELPLALLRAYHLQVMDVARSYALALDERDLVRVVDTVIFGKRTAAWLLQFVAVRVAGHAGEIAAVKGMQGLKGLPI